MLPQQLGGTAKRARFVAGAKFGAMHCIRCARLLVVLPNMSASDLFALWRGSLCLQAALAAPPNRCSSSRCCCSRTQPSCSSCWRSARSNRATLVALLAVRPCLVLSRSSRHGLQECSAARSRAGAAAWHGRWRPCEATAADGVGAAECQLVVRLLQLGARWGVQRQQERHPGARPGVAQGVTARPAAVLSFCTRRGSAACSGRGIEHSMPAVLRMQCMCVGSAPACVAAASSAARHVLWDWLRAAGTLFGAAACIVLWQWSSSACDGTRLWDPFGALWHAAGSTL